MRLAPEPPALLARLEADPADALVASLRKAGLSALAIDARRPDRRRPHHRASGRLRPGGRHLHAPVRGRDAVAWPDVLAVLRGSRESRLEAERPRSRRRLSVGMAVATGGLVMTRTSTKTVHSSDTSFQQVILVYARDGRAAALVEGQVDFSCLGAELQPSSTANMATLGRRLREQATGAFHDDRLLRLGRRPAPVRGRDTRLAPPPRPWS